MVEDIVTTVELRKKKISQQHMQPLFDFYWKGHDESDPEAMDLNEIETWCITMFKEVGFEKEFNIDDINISDAETQPTEEEDDTPMYMKDSVFDCLE